jgi:uncharacterized membrane protein YdjX (TVP38/TMEM64 family)
VSPLLEEMVVALAAVAALAALVSTLFWLTTGLSPWPGVVLGMTAGLGFGVSMLALTSPRRTR